MNNDLDTYEGWRSRGYQVRKGSKAVKYDLKREVHLFSREQVDVNDVGDADPDDAMEMWARGEWP